jgi:cbb3-type cytochrome oxidase subunit 1
LEEDKHIRLPKWFFTAACVVLGLLFLMAALNLVLNFLDARARASFGSTLEERGKRLDSVERRLDKMEANR